MSKKKKTRKCLKYKECCSIKHTRHKVYGYIPKKVLPPISNIIRYFILRRKQHELNTFSLHDVFKSTQNM